MSLDRRIVSILYHNGIFDVEKVEYFIGEKDNYYEILIDGEIKKLKIPGKEYLAQQFDKKFEEEVKKLKIKKRSKKSDTEEPLFEEETSFEEELKKNEIENKEFLEKSKQLFEQRTIKEELLESVEQNEKMKDLLIEGMKPKKPRTSAKKLKIIESKKIDDDIDDFINTI